MADQTSSAEVNNLKSDRILWKVEPLAVFLLNLIPKNLLSQICNLSLCKYWQFSVKCSFYIVFKVFLKCDFLKGDLFY